MNIEFPLAGIDRGASHQHVRPFTTQDLLNVRPYDVLENRARGGSRPPLAKAFSEQLGFDDPTTHYVNLMGLVRTAVVTPARTFHDHFLDVDDWTNAGWDDENVTQSGTIITGPTTDGNRAAIYKSSALDIDWNADFSITVRIIEREANKYRIFARMDQSSPAVSASIGCEVQFQTSGTTLRLLVDDASVLEESNSQQPDPYGFSGRLRLRILANYNLVIAEYFPATTGALYLDSVQSSLSAGDAIAVEMENVSGAIAAEIDSVLVKYTAENLAPQSRIVAASNGTLYSESTSGAMTAITGTPTFGDATVGQQDLESTPLSVAARFEKLYIADWAEPRKEVTAKTTDCTIADATGVLTHGGATAATFQTDGVIADGDVIEITDVAGDFSTGWYEVDSVDSETQLTLKTLESSPSAPSGASTSTAYRIVPGIKIYDAAADTVALMVSNSVTYPAPYGCRIVKLYRDRLVFSGDPNNPGDVFLSKQGDPLDYQYSVAGTVQDAFAFDAGGLGRLGAPTAALVPVFDDLMIVAGEGECAVLRGDPAVGGTFDHLSRRVGILSFDAWAPTDDDQIYFLSVDGFYRVHRNELAGLVEPKRVSPERIPDELRDIDPTTHHVFLEYDPEYLGIVIRITSLSSGDSDAWWYDIRLEGFFHDRYAEDHDAFCAVIDDLPNRLIVGCRDGYIRKFTRAGTTDDGTSFISYFDVGPIKLGRNGRDGYLDNVDVALDENSGACTIGVRTGKTPQAAKTAATFKSRTLAAGLNPSFRPRMRGRDAYLRIQNSGDVRWALEFMEAERKPGGRLRA